MSCNTMKANDTDNYERSQRELAHGVLKEAPRDLRRFHGAASRIARELYLDAYRWVMSDDFSWPFSFLGADPKGYAAAYRTLVSSETRRELADVACPVLALAAKYDPY